MKYYVIAGEASGDLHGSNLIKALKKLTPDLHIRAWGGDKMQAVGAEVVKHYKDLAFMGFLEVALNLRIILRNLRFCKKDILNFQPDALILIDYPGFNMRIARWAKQRGIPVHYYIMPQVWAWKESRVKDLARDTDFRYAILPFELDFFGKKHNLNVDFVGHPLLDALQSKQDPDSINIRKQIGIANDKPIIALLPGSRKQEIKKLLPVMQSLQSRFPSHVLVVAATPHHPIDFYKKLAPNLPIVVGQTYALLSAAQAALVTSGTATLETALFKIPQVVCYKTSGLSFAIAKRVVKLAYISLVNLIMDQKVVAEQIQNECTPEHLETALAHILSDEGRLQMLVDYKTLHQKLGGGGASQTTAELIYNRTHEN
ncbi:MAG: lipid-A-disaccharide synthase [Flavobacteriaceae bacterium]|nr:lipid-A-disaccharide synthase [Flavobacteriaceae bacterium]